ncbi:hypothetical protein F4780DRAFT_718118 [Xylariomycetidae sp. FL0641]|nr:hypothetical protein F4780DRAFT_718118 [Xylariomycetidae sp. FL0641]
MRSTYTMRSTSPTYYRQISESLMTSPRIRMPFMVGEPEDAVRPRSKGSYHTQSARQSPEPPKQTNLDEQAIRQLKTARARRRRRSVQAAEAFLRDFVGAHFGEHADAIRITADAATLDDIKMIGNETDQRTGVGACRRLFNAPVLSDQVGYLLWQELRQGEALGHSHDCEDCIPEYGEFDELEEEDVPPDTITPRPEYHLRIRCPRSCCAPPPPATAAADQPPVPIGDFTRDDGLVAEALADETTATMTRVEVRTKTTRAASAGGKEGLRIRKTGWMLQGIRRRALHGAAHLAASLGSGYCG